jgi:hypothetical protein
VAEVHVALRVGQPGVRDVVLEHERGVAPRAAHAIAAHVAADRQQPRSQPAAAVLGERPVRLDPRLLHSVLRLLPVVQREPRQLPHVALVAVVHHRERFPIAGARRRDEIVVGGDQAFTRPDGGGARSDEPRKTHVRFGTYRAR